MTSGFGVDEASDGNSGTQSSDIRKIFGGLYSPGIISGCTISTSPSVMSYTVAAGVVAIKTATGETILAPVPATTVNTAAAPATGSRTDIIYVQQRYPSIEGDANIAIGVATTLPARAVALKKYIVSAGNANTNAAVWTGGVDYSIPFGASLGILHQHRNTDNSWFTTAAAFGTASIYLPTDRLLRVSILTSVSAADAGYCEGAFDFKLDGVKKWKWNTTSLGQAWATYYWSDTIVVSAGNHTVSYDRYRSGGTGNPWHHYSAGDAPGTLFTVEDVGPSV